MLTCWIYKFRRIVLDENFTAGGHPHNCPRCAAECESEERIARSLSQSQPEAKDAPPFLASRVMAQLRTAEPPSQAFSLWKPALAFLFITALTAIMLLRPESAPPLVAESAVRAEPLKVTLPDTRRLLKAAEGLNQPLEQELQRMIEDAQGAVKYLAANFIPSSLER